MTPDEALSIAEEATREFERCRAKTQRLAEQLAAATVELTAAGVRASQAIADAERAFGHIPAAPSMRITH